MSLENGEFQKLFLPSGDKPPGWVPPDRKREKLVEVYLRSQESRIVNGAWTGGTIDRFSPTSKTFYRKRPIPLPLLARGIREFLQIEDDRVSSPERNQPPQQRRESFQPGEEKKSSSIFERLARVWQNDDDFSGRCDPRIPKCMETRSLRESYEKAEKQWKEGEKLELKERRFRLRLRLASLLLAGMLAPMVEEGKGVSKKEIKNVALGKCGFVGRDYWLDRLVRNVWLYVDNIRKYGGVVRRWKIQTTPWDEVDRLWKDEEGNWQVAMGLITTRGEGREIREVEITARPHGLRVYLLFITPPWARRDRFGLTDGSTEQKEQTCLLIESYPRAGLDSAMRLAMGLTNFGPLYGSRVLEVMRMTATTSSIEKAFTFVPDPYQTSLAEMDRFL